MKVLFINVPYGLEENCVRRPVFSKQPISHLWLAAILEQHNIDTEVYDAFALGSGEDEILAYIGESAPDIIGFTVYTAAVYEVIYLCNKICNRYPEITIVAGGYHAGSCPEDLISEPAIDFVCVGEGESTLPELINALQNKLPLSSIKGLVYKTKDSFVKNPLRDDRANLDTVPHPAYEKVSDISYSPWWSITSQKSQKFMSIITGRGCPMNCVWCDIAKTEGVKYRVMSIDRVIDEFVYLNKTIGVTHLSIEDPTFTVYKDRVMEICSRIVQENLSLRWSCNSTIIHADHPDMLKAMKDAGCAAILFGIESGNEEILKKVKKVSKEKVRQVIKSSWDAGIKPLCSFMLGLPGDTIKTMDETIDFATELNPATANFSIAIPYKGTRLFEEYEKKGFIKTRDWRQYKSRAVFETDEFTSEELEAMYVKAHRRFYWRPGYIWRKMRDLRSMKEFMTNVYLGLSLVKGRIGYKS